MHANIHSLDLCLGAFQEGLGDGGMCGRRAGEGSLDHLV